jgi:hypothetical protein
MSSLRWWPRQFRSAARTGNFSTCSPALFVTTTDAVNIDFIPFAAMADASA